MGRHVPGTLQKAEGGGVVAFSCLMTQSFTYEVFKMEESELYRLLSLIK